MHRKHLASVFLLTLLWPLGAVADFIGVTFRGQVWNVNEQTGGTRSIGQSGFSQLNSLAIDPAGTLFSVSRDRLIEIDLSTGAGTAVVDLDFGPTPVDVRGLAFAPDGALFAMNFDGGAGGALYTIDRDTGIGNRVGRVGVFLQSLEVSSTGLLYTWGRDPGLQIVDPLTGTATRVSPSGPGVPNMQSIAFSPDGTLFGVALASGGPSALLYTINPDTGVPTFVAELSPTFDFRGIAFPVRPVAIDIKPGSIPNPINLMAHGVIRVAILSSDTFDAADVDVTTLAFGPDGSYPSERPPSRFADVDRNGIADLVLHFPTFETGIAIGDTEACLTGNLLDGTPIRGCDAVETLAPPN